MLPSRSLYRILKIISIPIYLYQQLLLRLVTQLYGKLMRIITLVKNRSSVFPFSHTYPSLDSSILQSGQSPFILQHLLPDIHAGTVTLKRKNSTTSFIFSHIRSITQRTLIIRISQRYSPGSSSYLSIENNQIISHQVHIAVYLQTVAMTYKRRITRNHTILEIIIISNRFPSYICRYAMISQLVIHDILALVLVKFIIEK